ncbi:hypothetical protein VTK56DRAFT_730 [Thermocarpiscus australiensis]
MSHSEEVKNKNEARPASMETTDVTAISPSSEYLKELQSLVPSAEALKRAGYVLKELTDLELEQKKRCLTCGVRVRPDKERSKRRGQGQVAPQVQQPQRGQARQAIAEGSNSLATVAGHNPQGHSDNTKPSSLRCKFHPGIVASKVRKSGNSGSQVAVSADDHKREPTLSCFLSRRGPAAANTSRRLPASARRTITCRSARSRSSSDAGSSIIHPAITAPATGLLSPSTVRWAPLLTATAS